MIEVLIKPEPLGGFSARVPAFPGCYSEGETLSEAISNIEEAAHLWLEVASEIPHVDHQSGGN